MRERPVAVEYAAKRHVLEPLLKWDAGKVLRESSWQPHHIGDKGGKKLELFGWEEAILTGLDTPQGLSCVSTCLLILQDSGLQTLLAVTYRKNYILYLHPEDTEIHTYTWNKHSRKCYRPYYVQFTFIFAVVFYFIPFFFIKKSLLSPLNWYPDLLMGWNS